MKKILMMCAVVAAALCARAALPEGGPYTEVVDGIEWTFMVENGEASVGVSRYGGWAIPKGTRGGIIVPSVLGECKVTRIGDYAFAEHTGITAVVIPGTVKIVGKDAFDSCSALRDLTLCDGVETLGSFSFGACAIETVALPSSVIELVGSVFAQNPKKEFVVAGGNPRYYVSDDGKLLLDRYNRAVVGCLAKPGVVTIPEGIEEIGVSAFEDTAFTGINFPSTLKRLRMFALEGSATSVTELDFSGTSLRRVDPAAFFNSKYKKIVFPASLDELCELAFGGCSLNLKEVHFLGAEPDVPGEEDPDVRAAYEKLSEAGLHPTGDTLFTSVDERFTRCFTLKVTSYVQQGQGWEGIVAGGTWHGRPIKYDGSGPVPPGPTPPEPEEGFEEAHTFNGLVYAGEVMCGIVQVTTGKRTAKDQVKVGGFVMLTDGKKQTIKSVTEDIEGGKLNVETKAGKLGDVELEITDSGFTGSVGLMTVKSGDIGEGTGIVSGTLKMSYFDAKTNKLKTRSIKLGGVASGGEAAGTLETKGEADKTFEAVVE